MISLNGFPYLGAYALLALFLGWIEYLLLRLGGLVGSRKALFYTLPVHLIYAVAAPYCLLVAVVGGLLNLLGAANYSKNFKDFGNNELALPTALGIILGLYLVRALPLGFARKGKGCGTWVYTFGTFALFGVFYGLVGLYLGSLRGD